MPRPPNRAPYYYFRVKSEGSLPGAEDRVRHSKNVAGRGGAPGAMARRARLEDNGAPVPKSRRMMPYRRRPAGRRGGEPFAPDREARRACRRAAVFLLATVSALAGSALAAAAASGVVVDPEGRPIVGARACILVGGELEGLCVETDENGAYKLLPTTLPAVRISAKGYLPVKVAAVDQAAPIVLRRAAWLWVRLRDARSGEPIPEGEVLVTYSTGARKGPVPANAAGVRLPLEPGEIVVTGKAEGYRDGRAAPAVAESGKETQVVVDLERGGP